MSGAAAVCSASVDEHRARVDPDAGDAVVGERRRDDPAADDLADRQHGVERTRRHLAQHGQRVRPGRSTRSNSLSHIGRRPPARLVAGDRGRDRDMPLEQRLQRRRRAVGRRRPRPARDRHELVGDAAERRHDHHRRAAFGLSPAAGATMPIKRLIASGSATDVPPNFMTTLTASGQVGSRDLRYDSHVASKPSRCISSAFRIAAPAAPRIVLWPSATNL